MRQIFLDTETTGLDPAQGHRIIEIAAMEMVNRRFTGARLHRYINPDREVEAGALQVHGITNEFLQDKPRFRDLAGEILEFLSGAELVIHNAPFDVGFLDAELALLGMPGIRQRCAGVVDTLQMARELHPGKRNSLDALCERYQVDNSKRSLHGALLDTELLAEVYLALTRGQDSLMIEMHAPSADGGAEFEGAEGLDLIVLRASDEELAAHARQVEEIDKAARGACLWKRLDAEQAGA